MEVWVGPAIVAAFISGLVSLVLVQLNFRQERRIEQMRRDEKIRDFQIALRAEIRSELRNLERFDPDRLIADLRERFSAGQVSIPTIPRLTKHLVFEAIVGEIHILPEAVIDPVVLYVRQRQAIETLVEDIRDSSFRSLPPDRQLQVFEDYIGMWVTWRDLAQQAERALSVQDKSIKGPRAGLPSDGRNGG